MLQVQQRISVLLGLTLALSKVLKHLPGVGLVHGGCLKPILLKVPVSAGVLSPLGCQLSNPLVSDVYLRFEVMELGKLLFSHHAVGLAHASMVLAVVPGDVSLLLLDLHLLNLLQL